MRLKFLTSIASSRSSFVEGQVIEVPHLTPEFARWQSDGLLTVLNADERAEALPEMEMPDGPYRPSRRGGRGRRSSVSPPVQA